MGGVLELSLEIVWITLFVGIPLLWIALTIGGLRGWIEDLRKWRGRGYRYSLLQFMQDFASVFWGVGMLSIVLFVIYFHIKVDEWFLLLIYILTSQVALKAEAGSLRRKVGVLEQKEKGI